RAAELLGEHAELEVAEPGTAVRLGDGRARPAHLGHALPELGVVGRVGVEDAADAGGGRLLGQELSRRVAQRLLVRREVEVHRGPPERRSARADRQRRGAVAILPSARGAVKAPVTLARTAGARWPDRPRWRAGGAWW